MFVGLLRPPAAFTTFASALPYTSICLLLLGDRPSPAVGVEIIHMVELGMNFIPSFVRKFELGSGWSVLKNVLPHAWSPSVQVASFHVLMGYANTDGKGAVLCPQILPTILASLQAELEHVSGVSLPEYVNRGWFHFVVYAFADIGPQILPLCRQQNHCLSNSSSCKPQIRRSDKRSSHKLRLRHSSVLTAHSLRQFLQQRRSIKILFGYWRNSVILRSRSHWTRMF